MLLLRFIPDRDGVASPAEFGLEPGVLGLIGAATPPCGQRSVWPGSSGSWALPVEILSAMVAGAVLAQDTQDTDLPISATNSRSLPSCKTCLAR